ncbi:MAG TPA: LysE family translocator [Acidimicrobiales bacterium]|nr:LysE family translocator [Acidimicrobiales bacterium]
MLLSLGSFAVAATLIVLLPGPDTMVVLRGLLRGGRAAAARTAAGVLTGLVLWVGAAALGLAALLRASHDGSLVLRLVGGVYLVWMGVQSWRSRGAMPEPGAGRGPAGRVRSGYAAGLLTDLLNPKVGVFFVTFLPGFVPHGSPVVPFTVLLGGVFVVLTAAYFAALVAAAGRVRGWLDDRRTRRRVERATGAVLCGFGLRLVLE